MGRKNVLLGDFLLEQKLITEDELRKGLKHQKDTGKLLGRCLIELGIIDERTLIKALSEQMGVQYVSLKKYNIDPKVIQLVPEEFARNHKVVPLFQIDNKLTVGMVNPLDIITIDSLSKLTKMIIEPVVCHEQDVEDTINIHYKGGAGFDDAVKHYGVEDEDPEISQQDENKLRLQAEEGPVIKLVNLILTQAIKDGASDIHIQPRENQLVLNIELTEFFMKFFLRPNRCSWRLPPE